MAADKRALLRDALKLVQAGKIDKAIETYKAVVKADPRDATVHNTLGDLYVKQGKKREAIAEYLEASTLYEKDGFATRSIAICEKKVLPLDPSQLSVRLKHGDLYASQRLPAPKASKDTFWPVLPSVRIGMRSARSFMVQWCVQRSSTLVDHGSFAILGVLLYA